MIYNIGFVSLGCPKNLVDSENMIGILYNNDYKLTNDLNLADAIIINTCGFIEESILESINKILELSEYKKKRCKKLIVWGCLSERFREEVLKEIPEVDVLLGVGDYEKIIYALKDNKKTFFRDDKKVYFGTNERYIDKSKSYAYIKIADGCDNNCSYCVIPSIRGRYQSRNFQDILDESKLIVKNGIYELILIAQDLTRYGIDLYNEKRLVELIKELSKIEKLERIRLLYCYPDDIDDKLIEEISNNDKLVNYIDIPIQHVNDKILTGMNRKSNKKDLEKILITLRSKIPNVVLRTSIITGFPGENNKSHRELCEFIKKYKFDRLGVFKYSDENGSKSYEYSDKINDETKEKRYIELMEIQNSISKELMKNNLSKVLTCVVEGVADDGIFYFGRSYGETPDIDGLVYFTSERELKFNEYVQVKILDNNDYDLIGEVEK
ncbi:MAG: 30S ribosomal protein S12 methylthiotransferase RimO [Clostridiales bacterium]